VDAGFGMLELTGVGHDLEAVFLQLTGTMRGAGA
jgi:hypothetical protein